MADEGSFKELKGKGQFLQQLKKRNTFSKQNITQFKPKYRVKGGGMLSEKKKWKLLQEFKKLKKSEILYSEEKVSEQIGEQTNPKRDRRKRKPKQNSNAFSKAEEEFNKKKKEKEQQIKEREEERRKRKLLFEENKRQRRETYKKLNKRTKKGQPVMSSQIEHLLSKIQAQT